jgi:hypothetical protein
MSRNCGHRFVQQFLGSPDQAGHTHSGVYKQITLGAAHMPDIAAHQLNHMRFAEQRYAIVHFVGFEPALCGWKMDGAHVATLLGAAQLQANRHSGRRVTLPKDPKESRSRDDHLSTPHQDRNKCKPPQI